MVFFSSNLPTIYEDTPLEESPKNREELVTKFEDEFEALRGGVLDPDVSSSQKTMQYSRFKLKYPSFEGALQAITAKKVKQEMSPNSETPEIWERANKCAAALMRSFSAKIFDISSEEMNVVIWQLFPPQSSVPLDNSAPIA